MKNRLRDLMACGCLLGGAATTVVGQLLLDDKPEVGFLAIVVGLVLFVTGMGIALIAIGRHFLTNGFEVLHPRPVKYSLRSLMHSAIIGVFVLGGSYLLYSFVGQGRALLQVFGSIIFGLFVIDAIYDFREGRKAGGIFSGVLATLLLAMLVASFFILSP